MKAYTDATNAKDLLLQFQTYVKTISQRGPTDLTLYAENFAAKLMEIYCGYPFINMNYSQKNVAGIDLLNKENNHGIQITIQDNSADKVINSIENSKNYSKLTVFFFNPNKVDTIVNHVKEKGKWKDEVEVISLFDVFSLIEQDAVKATQIKELCDLWINGNEANYVDLIDRLNVEAEKRVESNRRSKKYIPDIYIPEVSLKMNCRTFVDPGWATEVLLNKAPTYFIGYCYDFIKGCTIEIGNNERLSFENDCNALSLLSAQHPDLHMWDIIQKLNNFVKFDEGTRKHHKLLNQFGDEASLDVEHSNYNHSVSFTIRHDLNEYSYAGKKYFFIVKDAGQGKTNFLCDLTANVLRKRKIPTIYLNVNELTKNLLEAVKDQISVCAGKEINQAMHLIEQYCSVANKCLIICIDGLNEKNNLAEFKNEVLELFRFADNYSFMKIISTSRNKAYQAFFKDFKNESFGDLIAEAVEKDKDIYGRKDEEFKNKIYTRYREFFKVGCYISSEARTKLSNDTLLLRLFCEVYENNSDAVVNDIFLYDLFSCYINKRGQQLFNTGRIKRQDDLIALLKKISVQMLERQNLNSFSYEGFSENEKDLLDVIVQEDILIKSAEDNGISLFGNKSSFSFTYDEFRDFLLANVLLSFDKDAFEKEVGEICGQSERYDGVLKFLFLFCKTRQSDRIEILKGYPVYNKLYAENIFSIEDRFLDESDIVLIKKSLENPKNKWVYYNVVKRLDVEHYKKLSVKDIVEVYISKFLNDPIWDTIFFDPTKPYQDESGILPELLKEKYMDTRDQEVYGILLFLCTVSAISSSKDKYLCWLGQAYKRIYREVLLDIARTMDELSGAAQYMLEELDNQ